MGIKFGIFACGTGCVTLRILWSDGVKIDRELLTSGFFTGVTNVSHLLRFPRLNFVEFITNFTFRYSFATLRFLVSAFGA